MNDKQIQDMITIGYATTKAEGLQMLADYNNNPFDTKAAKMTFSDVYEEWSKRKFPTISESNVKGYTAPINPVNLFTTKFSRILN